MKITYLSASLEVFRSKVGLPLAVILTEGRTAAGRNRCQKGRAEGLAQAE